jgi:hypothetical protein
MKYYTQARLFPTVLTSLPLLVLIYVAVHPFYDKLSQVISFLPVATITTFYAAFLFLCVQLNRIISKEVFQNLFFNKDELYMPTTTRLLWANNHYDDTIKGRIHSKIHLLYEVALPTKIEEQANEMLSRKTIVFAVSQIRNTLRENKMLLQHNIEYGFFRNLLGGCLLAVVVSLAMLVYAYITHRTMLITVSWVMVGVYMLPILFSKFFVNRLGNYYTKILIEQFLSHK